MPLLAPTALLRQRPTLLKLTTPLPTRARQCLNGNRHTMDIPVNMPTELGREPRDPPPMGNHLPQHIRRRPILNPFTRQADLPVISRRSQLALRHLPFPAFKLKTHCIIHHTTAQDSIKATGLMEVARILSHTPLPLALKLHIPQPPKYQWVRIIQQMMAMLTTIDLADQTHRVRLAHLHIPNR